MKKKQDVKKLLKAAQEPAVLARKMHPFYKGKIEVVPKCRIKDFNDFSV